MTRRILLRAVLMLLAAGLAIVLTEQAMAQARVPFGIGGGEGAATAPGNALAAYILSKQSEFYRAMSGAVRAMTADPNHIWTLLGLSFGYGAFHAAGPGHGKAVISSYIVADAQAIRRGFALALAAALFQGVVAIGLVLILAKLLGFTSIGLTAVTAKIETISYAAIALFGLWLVIRKGRAFIRSLSSIDIVDDAACDHIHLPPPEVVSQLSLRETAGVVAAAGSRPCTGSILIMIFTLSQGALMAGVASVGAISLGTALTTGAIAALAVFAKRIALGIAAGRSRSLERITRGVELLAAIAVLLLGLVMLAGYLSYGGEG